MGSNTRYKLQASSNNAVDRDKLAEKFEDITGMSLHWLDEEPMKWYDYDTDMVKLSTEYPEVLFTLTGVGEGPGDMRRHFFQNSMSQQVRVILTYPLFDKSKLQ